MNESANMGIVGRTHGVDCGQKEPDLAGPAPFVPLLGEQALRAVTGELLEVMVDRGAALAKALDIRAALQPFVAALVAEQCKAERERIAEAYWALGLRGAVAIGGWQSLLSHPDCPDQSAAMVGRAAFHRFMDLLQGRES
jgi:hypothetical protein